MHEIKQIVLITGKKRKVINPLDLASVLPTKTDNIEKYIASVRIHFSNTPDLIQVFYNTLTSSVAVEERPRESTKPK